MNYNSHYDQSYFTHRMENDPKRLASFRSEKQFINQYITSGRLLDVGCSTGEFIASLNWKGETYGMEVSEIAIDIAQKKGIQFDKDIFNVKDFFDLIIFRGTIQHIDTPFLYLKQSYHALKPNGFVCFLATPNMNSIYYKLWNTLPFLDPKVNFWIPSDQTLMNTMAHFGFQLIQIRYPYVHSPYASFLKDHFNFIRKCFGAHVTFAFWRNSMELIFKKNF